MTDDATTPKLSAEDLAGINRFLGTMLALTVYVVGCDDRNRPVETWGSGLLWERGDRLTLLTVAHNFKGGRPKRLDPRFPSAKGSLLIEIPEPGWMATASVDVHRGTVEKARDIDFAWVNYNLPKLRAKLEENLNGIKVPPFSAIRTAPTRMPEIDRPYGLAASIAKVYDPRSWELHSRNANEAAMAFEGMQDTGNFAGCYRFKLARPHQGDAYYRGSSGAPVADEDGHPVALVAGGDPGDSIIFATPLQPFVRYLDL
jgi:hypothetical protein